MKRAVFATAGIALGAIAWAGPVAAQTYVNQPVPILDASDEDVLGTAGSRGPLLAQQSEAVAGQRGNTAGLAFTGGDIAGLVLIGVALAGTGTAVVRLGRRPQSPIAGA